jgi:hypothetical protein
VANTLRILNLPEAMLTALSEGKITEGHTRPLLMLTDRKEEQETLFKEIIFKKLNVREAESIARGIAVDRARKLADPELVELEDKFKESLGTRVRIMKNENGGKLTIDFFSPDDLRELLDKLTHQTIDMTANAADKIEAAVENAQPLTEEEKILANEGAEDTMEASDDEDLYSVSNFTV